MLYGNLFQLLAIFILGVVVHEVINDLAWVYFVKKTLSALKFGFQLAMITPYVLTEVNCHERVHSES